MLVTVLVALLIDFATWPAAIVYSYCLACCLCATDCPRGRTLGRSACSQDLFLIVGHVWNVHVSLPGEFSPNRAIENRTLRCAGGLIRGFESGLHQRAGSPCPGWGRSEVVRFGELIVILELRQHGMSVSAIARRTGLSRGTVRKYITRGIQPPGLWPPGATTEVSWHPTSPTCGWHHCFSGVNGSRLQSRSANSVTAR